MLPLTPAVYCSCKYVSELTETGSIGATVNGEPVIALPAVPSEFFARTVMMNGPGPKNVREYGIMPPDAFKVVQEGEPTDVLPSVTDSWNKQFGLDSAVFRQTGASSEG